jgi:hypothetical protein
VEHGPPDGVRIEVDHVQRVADNGPDDWTVALCVDCHRRKTAAENRRAAKARKRGIRRPRPRVPGWLRPLTGWALVAGSIGWMLGYEREVTAAGCAALLLAVVVWVGQARRRRRREKVLGLTDELAKATNTIQEQARVRVRRWERDQPVEGTLRYSHIFDDADGSPSRAKVEALLTRRIGQPLRFEWWPPSTLMHWEPGEPVAVERPDAAREAVTVRLREGIESTLGTPLTGLHVDGWRDSTPTAFTAAYPARARAQSDRVQDEVEDKVAALLDGEWRAAWDTRNDRVTFTDTPDPLANVADVGPIPTTFDLAALRIGRRDDGTDWCLPLMGTSGITHLLIAGTTGSGKGSVIWSILNGMMPGIVTGHIQPWGGDPKGGMEFGKGREVWSRYEAADTGRIVDMLEDAVAVMDARAARYGNAKIRRHVPTPAEPLIYVFIDELGTLTKYEPDKALRDRANAALAALLSKGRAPGVGVIAALQDPRKEVLGNRDAFPLRIALRLNGHPDLVLGPGARAAGGRADRISADHPGVAYSFADGATTPVRGRAFWVPDEHIERMADTVARSRPRPQQAIGTGWEHVTVADVMADDDGGDWIRLDDDGTLREVQATGMVPAVTGGDDVEVDWRAADGATGCTIMSERDPVERRRA